MEAKERLLEDWKLTDIAETLYNFRGGMDIEGIKNTLWQLAKQQDGPSFKAGIEEVFQWLSEQPKEDACPDGGMYILVAIDKWQAKLQEWGIKEGK